MTLAAWRALAALALLALGSAGNAIAQLAPPRAAVSVLDSAPHDRHAFTEGLAFHKGHLYESSGEYGESWLREIDPATGKTLREVKLAPQFFAEGLAILDGKLYQLTYREHTCFVYDLATFKKLREMHYDGEGWGMTTDGKSLITTDGSEWVRFRDPVTFAVRRSIRVVYQGTPLANLNELEMIGGTLWANVWQTDLIVRVDPADGRIVGILDAGAVYPEAQRPNDPDAVLNGIAVDDASGAIWITGKRWPQRYRIAPPAP